MAKQLAGSIDWLFPIETYNHQYEELLKIHKVDDCISMQVNEFRILYKAPNHFMGWSNSWTGDMGNVGDTRTQSKGRRFTNPHGVQLISPVYGSFGYPIYGIAPIGYGIIYGCDISKTTYDIYAKQSEPFIVAYKYNVDTNEAHFMFSDGHVLTFTVHGGINGIACAHFTDLYGLRIPDQKRPCDTVFTEVSLCKRFNV